MKARKFVHVLQEFLNEGLSPREQDINVSVTICPQIGRLPWMNLLPASWALTRTDSQNKLTMCELLLLWEKFACILMIPCQIQILTVLCDQVRSLSWPRPPPIQVGPWHTGTAGVHCINIRSHRALLSDKFESFTLLIDQVPISRETNITATCLLNSKYWKYW